MRPVAWREDLVRENRIIGDTLSAREMLFPEPYDDLGYIAEWARYYLSEPTASTGYEERLRHLLNWCERMLRVQCSPPIKPEDFQFIDGPSVPVAELDAAKKRIAELELELRNAKLLHAQVDWAGAAKWASAVEDAKNAKAACDRLRERCNRLSDEAGALRTERDDLLRENAVLRRKLEAAERKGRR